MAGYAGEDGGVCTECPAGTFKPLNGSQFCDRCPFGKFSMEAGASMPGVLCAGWCCFEEPAAILPKPEWCTHIGTDTVCAAQGEVNCSGTGRSVCTLFRVDGDDDPVLIPRPPFFHRLSRLLSPPRQPAGTLLPSFPLDSAAPLVARAPTTREQQGGGALLLSSDAVRPTCSRREQVRCASLKCQPVRCTSRGATQRWHCLQAACHIRATLGSVSATVGLWNERASEIQIER